MTDLANWIADAGWLVVCLLLFKITIVLGIAWLMHLAAERLNPRWRVAVWRSTSIAILVLGLGSLTPPLLNIPVLLPSRTELSVLDPSGDPTSFPTGIDSRAESTSESIGPSQAQSPLETVAAPKPMAAGTISKYVPVDDRATPSQTDAVRTVVPGVVTVSSASIPHRLDDGRRPLPGVVTPVPHLVFVAWLIGVIFGTGSYWVGRWRLSEIRRQSTGVDHGTTQEARTAAASLDVRRSFDIRQTRDLQSPCLIGFLRPLILIPEQDDALVGTAELPAIVAHELAHVRGRDVFWNAVLNAVSVLFWFHPLMWRVRTAHVDACDAVCDALAAHYVGSTTSYARTLARLTLRLPRRRGSVGLAMARSSSVTRRIASLQRRVYIEPLPGLRTAGLWGLALLSSGLIGTATLSATSDEPQPANSAEATAGAKSDRANSPQTATGQIKIRLVDDESSTPVPKQQLNVEYVVNGERTHKVLTVNADGAAEFDLKPGANLEQLLISTETSLKWYAAVGYFWDRGQHADASPGTIELRLARGLSIGGVVQDATGTAIPGADVKVTMRVTSPRQSRRRFIPAIIKTNEEGKWLWEAAPQDLSRIKLSVSHPDYVSTVFNPEMVASKSHIVQLQKGHEIAGQVTNSSGASIAGAVIRLGNSSELTELPTTQSDADGKFTLRQCPAGNSHLTIQAPGYAPQIKLVAVPVRSAGLVLPLLPGRDLKVRVVDRAGKPLEGATFSPRGWPAILRSPIEGKVVSLWDGALITELRTNSEGRATWSDAPESEVFCDVTHPRMKPARDILLKTTPAEHVITLAPELVVQGHVKDSSGKPIENFQVLHGLVSTDKSPVNWSLDECEFPGKGAYRIRLQASAAGHLLKVAAPGFLSQATPEIRADGGAETRDLVLSPARGPTGVVLLPDGTAAVGAQIGVSLPGKQARIENGAFDQRIQKIETVTTDQQGRFLFPNPVTEPYVLALIHDKGAAEVTGSQLKKSSLIKLHAWGQIQGRSIASLRPDEMCEVSTHATRDNVWTMEREATPRWESVAKTDNTGKFQATRIFPGDVTIGRTTYQKNPGGRQRIGYSYEEQIHVFSGKVTTATVGGSGRTIVGRLTADSKTRQTVDWQNAGASADVVPWDVERGQRADHRHLYLSEINSKGQFRILDVPAGDYQLTVMIRNRRVITSPAMAEMRFHISVPEATQEDRLLDLAEIELFVPQPISLGTVAPKLRVPNLKTGQINLDAYRGKLVLLDFWSPTNLKSIARMKQRRALHAQFKDHPRFAMVGIVCDAYPEIAKHFSESNGINWPQGHVLGSLARTAREYDAGILPVSYLIAPDGKLLSRDLSDDELASIIAAEIANDELFAANPGKAARRFPLLRYSAKVDQSANNAVPAAVLHERAGFEVPGAVGQSSLRAISASGETIWEQKREKLGQLDWLISSVTIDRARQKIYLQDNTRGILLALNLQGQRIWQLESLGSCSVAMDDQTGNLWCARHPTGQQDEVVVIDPLGNEVATHDYSAFGIAYDHHAGAFWLTAKEVTKIDRHGKRIFQKTLPAKNLYAVAVDSSNGEAWVAEQSNPGSANVICKLWRLDKDGKILRELEHKDAFFLRLEHIPKSGETWIFPWANIGAYRIPATGPVRPVVEERVQWHSVSPTTGDVWVVGESAVLRLSPNGKIQSRIPLTLAKSQVRMAAF